MSGYRVDAKVVLLGREFCGKTSLVERYIHNRFAGDQPYQSTIGAAYGAKRVEAFGRLVVLGIWDTAGSERYQAMSRIYYRDTWAALLCYDLTSRESWDKVRFWCAELHEHEPHARIYFVGTKKDMIDAEPSLRQVKHQSVLQFAEENGHDAAAVFETSSKTGEGIKQVFDRIAKDFVKQSQSKPQKSKETHGLVSLDAHFGINSSGDDHGGKRCRC